jgi:guanosine-3',5'-bis(diphosphate) 3'-pyrophosphohydrolase
MTTVSKPRPPGGPGFEEFAERLQGQIESEKIDSLRRAYEVAERAHEGQLRFSGEPFVSHPLQTAIILTDVQFLDSVTLQAALLHDVVEDSAVSLEEIENEFGEEVARLVDGVTKLAHLTTEPVTDLGLVDHARQQDLNHLASQAESLRKMLVAMAQDVRVVFIKLADRLHNMRTLAALPEEKRRRISIETREIYAPLAHRLGLYAIEWELEDHAFSHLERDEYRRVVKLVDSRRGEREEQVQQAMDELKSEMAKVNLKPSELAGRPKSLYSIYQKMQRYEASGREFGDIYDLLAVRIIVATVQDCYAALGVTHGLWRPVPGQFDDYIASPHETGYQSLHTTVMAGPGKPLEVQIRTPEMHQLAEYGVAAHWRYKEGGGTTDVRFEDRITWLRQLLDWQRDVTGAEEFVQQVKGEILPDQVFVYTPAGEIRELPAGSTPLDFAFRIHTDLGYRAVGAKVNGRLVSYAYQLKNGDTVEIVSSKSPKGPSLDWLNRDLGYVRTEQGRTKIRQWFRKQERTESLVRGKHLLEREARRLGMALDPVKLAGLFGYDSEDEFLLALGTGMVSTSQVAMRLAPVEERQPVVRVSPTAGELTVEVLGSGQVFGRTGRCCRPLPGEPIVGFITRNRGVTVHRMDCPNLVNEDEPERIVDVRWPGVDQRYPSSIMITAQDRTGLLRDITTIVSAEQVNIIDIHDRRNSNRSVTISITVETSGLPQVSRLLMRLEEIPEVERVHRITATAAKG